MATTLSNRILIRAAAGVLYDEGLAKDGNIKPGHLIELTSDVTVPETVQRHSTAGGRSGHHFALEDGYSGPSVYVGGRTPDTAYTLGDRVPYVTAVSGTIVTARLKAGVAYALGDRLVSAGDGTLEKESALASSGLEKQAIAEITDAPIDLSVSGAVSVRHPARVL